MEETLEKPRDEDCCGSGCTPCIFDVYEQKLKQKEKMRVKDWSSAFSDVKYKPFSLLQTHEISSNLRRYIFQSVDNENLPVSSLISFKSGDYIIMRSVFKNSNDFDEQISRPYTPIMKTNMKGQFEIIVQLYEGGKMSAVFRKLTLGSITHWRGPYNHLQIKKTKFLVLLGAGTGIIPLYNIAKEIVDDEDDESIIKIIGCFRNLESISLRDEMQALTNYWNCNVQYYVSRTEQAYGRYNEKINFENFTEEAFKNTLTQFNVNNVFVVICGPDGFNSLFRNCALKCNLQENENFKVLS